MGGKTLQPTVRGPKITVSCRCGEKRYLAYGERWTCESCGRTWDTRQIPAEQYAAIRATQLRYRRVPLAISVLALVCIVAGLLVGKVARRADHRRDRGHDLVDVLPADALAQVPRGVGRAADLDADA